MALGGVRDRRGGRLRFRHVLDAKSPFFHTLARLLAYPERLHTPQVLTFKANSVFFELPEQENASKNPPFKFIHR